MKKILFLLVLAMFMSPVLAKNEGKKAVKAVKDVEKAVDRYDRGYDGRDRDWDDGLRKDLNKGSKGNGKPLAPGAQGKTNAAVKQATNGKSGKGGKGGGHKNYDLEDALRGELRDDNKGGKNNNKGGKRN